MKLFSFTLGLVLSFVMIRGCVVANYEYEKSILSNWSLADKASTIEQKEEYLNKFVSSLEKANIAESTALIFVTPNNSFKYNLEAIKSLQKRLTQIKGMNPASFEYQTAIQQIIAQEQGEAHNTLAVLEECWVRANYWYIWNIYGFISIFLILVLIATPIALWID